MADDQVSLGFDASDVIDGIQKLNAALAGNADAMEDTVIKLAKFNKEGKLTSGIIEGLYGETSKIVGRFRDTGDVLKVTSARIEESTSLLRAQAKAQAEATKEAEKQAEVNRRTAAEVDIRRLFPSPPGESVKEVERYEAAIARTLNIVQKSSGLAGQIGAIGGAVKTGTPIVGLTQEESQLRASLGSIQQLFEETGSAGERAGKRILLSFEDIVRLFERQVLRRLINEFITELTEGVKQSLELEVRLASLEVIFNRTSQSVAQFNQQFKVISDRTGIDQLQIAEAAFKAFGTAVGSGAQGYEILSQGAQLAAVTGQQVVSTTQSLVNVLEAFHLSATSASTAAGTLFNTIRQTGVDANELTAGFGRIGPQARELGLSIQELNAAFVTIHNQGVSTHETFNLINSILSKLINPSKEMKEVFKEWGVNSGEAAIATFGFSGVLEKLNTELSKEGGSKLGELAGTIGNLKGILDLTGEGLQEYQSNLTAARNSQDELNKASKEMGDNAAVRLKKELNEITNTFKSMGAAILQDIESISNTFGGVNKVVNLLITGLKALAIGWVTQRAYIIATTVASVDFSAALTVLRGGFTSLFAAEEVATAGALTFKTAIQSALISTGVGALIVALTSVGELLLTDSSRADELNNKLNEQNQRIAEVNRLAEERKREDFEETTHKNVQVYEQYAASIMQQLNQLAQAEQDVNQTTHEHFKATYEAYIEYVKDQANQAKNSLREIDTEIKNLTKSGESFRAQIERTTFEKILERSAPTQQIDLIKKRIENLHTEITELTKKGAADDIKVAEEKWHEIERLDDKAYDIQIKNRQKQDQALFDAARAAMQEQDKLIRGHGVTIHEPPKEHVITYGERNALLAKSNELAKEFTNWQQQALDRLEKQKKVQEDTIKTQEQRVKDIEQTAKKLAELEDPKNLAKTLAGPDFKGDTDKYLKSVEDTRKKLLELAGPDVAQKSLEFFRAEKEQELAITKELATAKRQVEVQQIEEQAKSAGDRFIKTREEMTKANEKLLQTIDDGLAKGPAFVHMIDQLNKAGYQGPSLVTEQLKEKAEQAEQAIVKFSQNKTAENLELRAEALQKYLDALTKYLEQLSHFKIENIKSIDQLPGAPSGTEWLKQLREFTEESKNASVSIGMRNEEINSANEILQKQTETLSALREKLKEAGAQGLQAGGQVKEGFATIEVEFQGINKQLQDMATNLQNIKNSAPNLSTPTVSAPVAPGGAIGGPIYYMFGGAVPGGPKGTDNVPAWLSPGEFVINANSASKFYSQLVAINAGIQPRYFQSGGSVTNVGDINVSVQGGDTSELTVRRIGQQLVREIRRGTIRLD